MVERTAVIVIGFAVIAALVLQVVPLVKLPVAAAQGSQSANEEIGVSQDNLFIFTTVDDFGKGETDGTQVIDSGNGAIVLEDGASSGTYTSPIVETMPFEYMVLSWNADTPQTSHIEIQGRVRVKDEWTDWLSWGRWSTSAFTVNNRRVLPGSGRDDETDNPLAMVSIDELIVKGQSGETANAFQYRVVLHVAENPRANEGVTPKVRLVASTLKNTLPGQAIAKKYPDDAQDLTNFEKDLDVPCYSQMVRDYKIANSICSPTSVAMVLSYYGLDISPEEVAWDVHDHEAGIFGNWAFNVAAAASYGFVSYVDYVVPEEGADPWYYVKQQIALDRPVVVSVRYKNPSIPGDMPPVEGVPIDSTEGHLVLVRGFTWKDGIEYVIVNDPAAPDNETVRREYRADQFFDAWVKRAAYVIYRDENEIDGIYAPIAISAELVPEGKTKDGYYKMRLTADGQNVDVNSASFRSVVLSYESGMPTPFILKSSSEAPDLLLVSAESEPGTYTFTFIGKNKDKYKAEITLPLEEPRSNLIPIVVMLVVVAIVVLAFMSTNKKRAASANK